MFVPSDLPPRNLGCRSAVMKNCAAAGMLRPTHPPLRFAGSPPAWLTWVLPHPRNEFPRESGDPFHRGASNKNGQGKVRGGQPEPFRASHWIKEQD